MDQNATRFYDDNGYFIIRNLVDAKTLQCLRAELDEAQARVESGDWVGNHLTEADGVARVVFNPYEVCPKLRQLTNRPDVIAHAHAFLGTDLQLHHTKLMCKPARQGTEQPPHQDYYYWQGKKANQTALFLAIDEATQENGCLWVVPGSHKQGLLEHKAEYHSITRERHWVCPITGDMHKAESFVAEPGDALFFGSLTIHYSGGNSSSKPRRAVIAQYDEVDNLEIRVGWGGPARPVRWEMATA